MRRTVLPAAASALVATAAAVLLALPLQADVTTAAAKHKVLRCRLTESGEDKASGLSWSQNFAIDFDLRANRFRKEIRSIIFNGLVDQAIVTVQDGPRDRCLVVVTQAFTDEAKAESAAKIVESLKDIPHKEAVLRRATVGWGPPSSAWAKPLLERLREVERHPESARSKDRVGAREAVMYRLVRGSETTKLWIDAETGMPAKLEVMADGLEWVITDFEWDPRLKGFASADALFATDPAAFGVAGSDVRTER